jgi:hypothetical protein
LEGRDHNNDLPRCMGENMKNKKKKLKRVVDVCIMSINNYIHSNSNIIQWQAYKSKNKSTRNSADSAIPTLMLSFYYRKYSEAWINQTLDKPNVK